MSARTAELPNDQLRVQLAGRQVSPDKCLRRSEHAGVVGFILDPRSQLASKYARRQLNRCVQRRGTRRVLQAWAMLARLSICPCSIDESPSGDSSVPCKCLTLPPTAASTVSLGRWRLRLREDIFRRAVAG